jgi:hypothetical protein
LDDEEMLIVAVGLPGVDEGRASVEEMCVTAAGESRGETKEVRSEFSARGRESAEREEKTVIELKIGDRVRVGRK